MKSKLKPKFKRKIRLRRISKFKLNLRLQLKLHRYLSFISTCLHRQALSAYPPASSEQLLVGEPTTGIRGISPHKVYPPLDLRRDAVRSYRTFSPLPKFYGFTVLLLYCCMLYIFSRSEITI